VQAVLSEHATHAHKPFEQMPMLVLDVVSLRTAMHACKELPLNTSTYQKVADPCEGDFCLSPSHCQAAPTHGRLVWQGYIITAHKVTPELHCDSGRLSKNHNGIAIFTVADHRFVVDKLAVLQNCISASTLVKVQGSVGVVNKGSPLCTEGVLRFNLHALWQRQADSSCVDCCACCCWS